VSREEGMTHSDSPTNLMWRLQNDMGNQSKLQAKVEEVDDGPSFTEITLDVHTEERTISNTRF
jgi:twitching motility protein PilU